MWDKRTRTLDLSSISRIQAGCPGCGRACPTARSRVGAVGSRAVSPLLALLRAVRAPPGTAGQTPDVGGKLQKPAPESDRGILKGFYRSGAFRKDSATNSDHILRTFLSSSCSAYPRGCPESLLQLAGHGEGLLNLSFPLSHAGSRSIQNCISDPQAARLFSITPMRTSLHKQPLIF